MKKLLASLAVMFSLCAHAAAVEVSLTGFPEGVATLSFEPGFDDNVALAIGGLTALVDGAPTTVYTTTLPFAVTLPDGTETFSTLPLSGPLANFLTYTAPLVNSIETSAAVQLGVWSLSGLEFEVVDNISIGNAVNLAIGWIDASANLQSNTLLALQAFKKPYGELVFATPVPEPETYALFALGLAVLGVAAKRAKGRSI